MEKLDGRNIMKITINQEQLEHIYHIAGATCASCFDSLYHQMKKALYCMSITGNKRLSNMSRGMTHQASYDYNTKQLTIDDKALIALNKLMKFMDYPLVKRDNDITKDDIDLEITDEELKHVYHVVGQASFTCFVNLWCAIEDIFDNDLFITLDFMAPYSDLFGKGMDGYYEENTKILSMAKKDFEFLDKILIKAGYPTIYDPNDRGLILTIK